MSLTGLMMDDLFLLSQVNGKSTVRELMWATQISEDKMAKVMAPVFTSQDAREGARAFAEKRAPVWKGE